MTKEWKDWTDEELASDAEAGLRGLGSAVEMMRRLRDATTGQQDTMIKLTKDIT